jgi:RNA polymerase sigma factor (sigma-70 family)
MMTLDDRERVRRFQRGEPGGFEALFSDYGDRVYQFCYRLCGHAADAEDLAQEVFLAAYQGLDRIAGRSSVATWLFRIAVYRWRRIRDTRRPETVPLDEERGAAAVSDPIFQSGLIRGRSDSGLKSALRHSRTIPRQVYGMPSANGWKERRPIANRKLA